MRSFQLGFSNQFWPFQMILIQRQLTEVKARIWMQFSQPLHLWYLQRFGKYQIWKLFGYSIEIITFEAESRPLKIALYFEQTTILWASGIDKLSAIKVSSRYPFCISNHFIDFDSLESLNVSAISWYWDFWQAICHAIFLDLMQFSIYFAAWILSLFKL